MALDKRLALVGMLALSACGKDGDADTAGNNTRFEPGDVVTSLEECRETLRSLDLPFDLQVLPKADTSFQDETHAAFDFSWENPNDPEDTAELEFVFNTVDSQWSQVVDGLFLEVLTPGNGGWAFVTHSTEGQGFVEVGDEASVCVPVHLDPVELGGETTYPLSGNYACIVDLSGNASLTGVEMEVIGLNEECDEVVFRQAYEFDGTPSDGYDVIQK